MLTQGTNGDVAKNNLFGLKHGLQSIHEVCERGVEYEINESQYQVLTFGYLNFLI